MSVDAPGRAPRRRLLAALSGLAAAPLAGCVGPIPLDAPPVAELPPPVPEWIVARATEADDGRRVELARGASLAVSLRAPSAAGIGWREVAVPPGLVLTGRFTGPVWPKGAPTSAVLPPPLWQVFVFEAREPGGGDLVLELGGETVSRPRRLSLRVAVPR